MDNMKKYTPYIFPGLVFLLVFFLVFRWFQLRNQTNDLDFSEGIEIENLSLEEQKSVLSGVGDYSTVSLDPKETEENSDAMTEEPVGGVVRYAIEDGKVRFSVIVNAVDAQYSVWLRDPDTEELSKAFDLVPGKGGLVGSAALSTELLPVEVVVSTSADKAQAVESAVLRGMIKPMAEEQN